MKKTSLTIAMMLILALPVFGLAAEAAETAAAEDTQTAQTSPRDGQYGRRSQTSTQNLQQYSFIDEDGDGLCDICGKEPGMNTDAPGFTDEDGDGVCDHLGTDLQHQGQAQKVQNKVRGGNQAGQNSQAQNRAPGGRNRR